MIYDHVLIHQSGMHQKDREREEEGREGGWERVWEWERKREIIDEPHTYSTTL